MPHTLHDVLAHHEYALNEVRVLFQDYTDSLGDAFCSEGFEEELALLPGQYSAPDGALFLLRVGNVPAGCVGIRRLEPEVCELKRLYVTPVFRGTGLGKWLLESAIERARELGYPIMKLDTLARLEPAVALYRKRGFQECASYNSNAHEDIRFMQLEL
jgi:GNAT superfamily N-acetyltransferase